MAAQKRDNDYFKKKLRTKNRALYEEVVADRMSVNKARQLAGMGGKRTWLSQLKHAWKSASQEERDEFLSLIGLAGPKPHGSHAPASIPVPASSSPASPLAPGHATPVPGYVASSAFEADGSMSSWAQRRVLEILARRRMRSSDLAVELGLKRSDTSVVTAAQRRRVLSPPVALEVDRWLKTNASV